VRSLDWVRTGGRSEPSRAGGQRVSARDSAADNPPERTRL